MAAAHFRRLVEFNLLHEFTQAGHFDWHVDTKPGDGKASAPAAALITPNRPVALNPLRLAAQSRSWNINVLLSEPGVDFTGGALQVGALEVQASRGDLYMYAASTPHIVRPIESGRRYTLVIALRDPPPPAWSRSAAEAAARDRRRIAYWESARRAYEALVSEIALGTEFKVHMLKGEFHEGLGETDEAQRSYCASYRATGEKEAAKSVWSFMQKGVAALRAHPADYALAEKYFAMGACVQPNNADLHDALREVRAAMRLGEPDEL